MKNDDATKTIWGIPIVVKDLHHRIAFQLHGDRQIVSAMLSGDIVKTKYDGAQLVHEVIPQTEFYAAPPEDK